MEDGQNGYTVPLDVKKYADTLADLLPDRQRLQRFGEHSAALSEKYSIEAQVKSLEKLYLEAILQNWRGNFFKRMFPRQINEIPTRIRSEIDKLMPGRNHKKD